MTRRLLRSASRLAESPSVFPRDPRRGVGLELYPRAQRPVRIAELNVSGFLPAKAIGDRPQIDGATLKISVGKRILSFTEGYTISVLVKDVDFLRLQVIFELAK